MLDSGSQVILVGYFRTVLWLLSLFLPSSFGGHNLRAFLRQLGKKIIPPSSQSLLSIGTWCLVCSSHCPVYVYMECQESRVQQHKEMRCSVDYSGGGCTWLAFSMGSMFSFINFALKIFRKWFITDPFFKKRKKSASQIQIKTCMQNFKDALHAYTYIDIHRWYNIGGENNANYI